MVIKIFYFFLSLIIIFPFQTVEAFLVPGSVESQSSSLNQSVPKFLASSSSVANDRNEMGSQARNEDKVPKVDIIITPTNPRIDESVYAQATPLNFRNVQTKLYYNWYIYNPDPNIGSTLLNKDGSKLFIPSNTLEGALIRGAIAQSRGTKYIPGVSPKARDVGKASEEPSNDRDGYNAYYGGDDGQGAIEKKIEDILGENYDFSYSDFTKNCKQNCLVEFNKEESEIQWEYKKCFEPNCSDWIESCCQVCKPSFEGCLNEIWSSLDNTCFDNICQKKDKDKEKDCFKTLSLQDYATCDDKFFSKQLSCTETRNVCCVNNGSCGTKPDQECTECEKNYHEDIWKAQKEKDYCKNKCEVSENNFMGSPSVEPVGSRCFRYNFGSKELEDHLFGIFQPVTCVHYFPGADSPKNVFNWQELIPFKTADGSFKEDEEVFWGTDPTNSDTDGDGYLDEADIAGLGQQTIEFSYKNGDSLGVVVEGTSLFPTNEKTPFYKIMWAHLDTCNLDVISQSENKYPKFNNLCVCKDKKDGKCDASDDLGYGYLGLKEIWQRMDNENADRLETMINLYPLRPTVDSELILDGIISGNSIEEDLIHYSWVLKHEGEVLKPEKDERSSRLIWKKQAAEAAFTELVNSSADFKNDGGIGWKSLKIKPLLEGKYTAILKATQIEDTKQIVGETAFSFNVSEKLRVRFFSSELRGGILEKREELVQNEVTPFENIIVEYEGIPFEDYLWSIDKKILEDDSPKIAFEVKKPVGTSYKLKLLASNRNHTEIAEDEAELKVVDPGIIIKPLEIIDSQDTEKLKGVRPGATYNVPAGTELEFEAIRSPIGSAFSFNNDLEFYWSYDEKPFEKGSEKFKVKIEGEKFLPKTPHTLSLRLQDKDGSIIASDRITLVCETAGDEISKKSEDSIGGLAFTYLNLSNNFKFFVQTFLWAILLFLLLHSIAWLVNLPRGAARNGRH